MFMTLMMFVGSRYHYDATFSFSAVSLLHGKVNAALKGAFISCKEADMIHAYLNRLQESWVYELRRTNRHQEVYQ